MVLALWIKSSAVQTGVAPLTSTELCLFTPAEALFPRPWNTSSGQSHLQGEVFRKSNGGGGEGKGKLGP